MRIIEKYIELAVILAIIFSGAVSLAIFKEANNATFLNLDEMLWMERADVFRNNISEGNFSGLIQSGQPGITVMWIAGPMMQFVDFDFNNISKLVSYKESQGIDFNFINSNDQALYSQFKGVSFLFNIPFLLLIFFGFLASYYLLKKLKFPKIILFIALSLVVTNPWFMYFTTPTDKCLMVFVALSLFSLMVYGNKISAYKNIAEEKLSIKKNIISKKFLFAFAVLGALAALSKLTALFFIFLIPFILLFYLLPISKKKIEFVAKDCLIWGIVFCVILTVLLPTIIFYPNEVIDYFFHASSGTLEGNYQSLLSVPKLKDYSLQFINIIAGFLAFIPLLFFAVFALISSVYLINSRFPNMRLKLKKIGALYLVLTSNQETIEELSKIKKHLIVLAAYFVFFFTMTVLLCKNHDIRYLAPAFLIMNIFAAIAVYWLIGIIKKKFNFGKNIYPFAVFLLIITQMVYVAASVMAFRNS